MKGTRMNARQRRKIRRITLGYGAEFAQFVKNYYRPKSIIGKFDTRNAALRAYMKYQIER